MVKLYTSLNFLSFLLNSFFQIGIKNSEILMSYKLRQIDTSLPVKYMLGKNSNVLNLFFAIKIISPDRRNI
jgi:hypothetical protein